MLRALRDLCSVQVQQSVRSGRRLPPGSRWGGTTQPRTVASTDAPAPLRRPWPHGCSSRSLPCLRSASTSLSSNTLSKGEHGTDHGIPMLFRLVSTSNSSRSTQDEDKIPPLPLLRKLLFSDGLIIQVWPKYILSNKLSRSSTCQRTSKLRLPILSGLAFLALTLQSAWHLLT